MQDTRFQAGFDHIASSLYFRTAEHNNQSFGQENMIINLLYMLYTEKMAGGQEVSSD